MRCGYSDARDCCECNERVCRAYLAKRESEQIVLSDAEEPEEIDYE